MRRLAGQAGRGLTRVLHTVLHVAIGFAVVMMVAAGLLVWRLSQGPIHLDSLAPRLNAKLNAELAPLQLRLGSVALAWEGWRDGLDRPVDLRVGGLRISDAAGAILARIPRAGVSLSFGWLLLGRIVPRAIEIDGAHLQLFRMPNGALSLSFDAEASAANGNTEGVRQPVADLLAVLGRPRQTDSSGAPAAHPRWTQLRRIHIGQADLVMVDGRLGTVWHAPRADLDLLRHRKGGLTAKASLLLAVDGQTVPLSAEASLPAGGGDAAIRARLGPVPPGVLARLAPTLAGLASPIEAPLQATISADLRPGPGSGSGVGYVWRSGVLRADLGQGAIKIADDPVPILGATMTVEATPDHAHLTRLRVVLAGRNGGGPMLQARGDIDRKDGHLIGNLDGKVDQVAIADLARYWPAGVAKGARAWVIRNVTSGTARAARVSMAFRSNEDGTHLDLTAAKAHVSADNLTIHWLRPVPPVEGVKAELSLLSPDALVITTHGGRQAGTAHRGILARSGTIKITGLMEKDQVGAIGLDLVGSVPDVLAVLKQPRLRLLSKHPIALREPTGHVTADLSVKLPLDSRVTLDQIAIQADGKLHALHLGAVAGKADLDDGMFDLKVDTNGLQSEGTGKIGGIPGDIGVRMDFRAGPATQVLRRYTVSATAEAAQLARFGVDPGDLVAGPIGLKASVLERRNGSGEADLQTDLSRAELTVRPLGWRKPRGRPADASARVLLVGGRVARIDRITLQGQGLAVAGAVSFAGGRPELIRLDRLVLGNTRGSGDIRLPASRGEAVRVRLAGSSLDLSPILARSASARPPGSHGRDAEQPWAADLRFDRVVLGKGRSLAGVVAQVQSDGDVIRHARIDGRTSGTSGFVVSITPGARNTRRLTAQAADAGALLRAFGVVATMDGGTLALSANYDDGVPGHPLSGTAEIASFRLRDAPAATRVLQAMTLYGLVAALRGPGVGVSRLIAPFRLTGDVLELDEARAFSPSLGFTAHGWIDLARRLADVRGTIVPAYFFNSLLGHIPLLGALFSPEKGGGVFAATYAVRGRLDDPAVTVNPLAALTPGFLRGLFGVFTGGNEQARSATSP